MKRLILTLAILLLSTAGWGAVDSVHLGAGTNDCQATLISGYGGASPPADTGSNFGSYVYIAAHKLATDNPAYAHYRSLIKWDSLKTALNAVVVDSAFLYLYASATSGGADTATYAIKVQVYGAVRAWSQTQATWNVSSTGVNWGTKGCDNATTDHNAISSDSVHPYVGTWCKLNVTGILQNWDNGNAAANEGFLLLSQVGTDYHGFFFHSDDYVTNTALRPYVSVYYTTGGGGVSTGKKFAGVKAQGVK
jgi:hypothetical protein